MNRNGRHLVLKSDRPRQLQNDGIGPVLNMKFHDDGIVKQSERPPTPRWVKIFGTALAVFVILIVLMFFLGDNHGPNRHVPSQKPGAQHT